MDEPAVFYSPRASVEDRETCAPNDWRYSAAGRCQMAGRSGSF